DLLATAAARPRILPVESEAQGIEDRRLAGARVPCDGEKSRAGEGLAGEIDLERVGEARQGLAADRRDTHRLTPPRSRRQPPRGMPRCALPWGRCRGSARTPAGTGPPAAARQGARTARRRRCVAAAPSRRRADPPRAPGNRQRYGRPPRDSR